MQSRSISKALQTRIRRYVEYMNEEKKNGFSKGEYTIISSLSSNLRKELKIEAYSKYLNKIPCLKYFSEEFLKNLCPLLKEETFAPEEFITYVNKFYYNFIVFEKREKVK